MGDPDSFELENTLLLDADSIPNENQSYECFSCGESMNGVFCYACGNKNDNYRRSIWSLGTELFASLTAFEGRIWRSLRSLIFKPGAMAREFSDGARMKWTSPIRMYLAMSLILFGYVAISQTQLIAFGTKADPASAFQASAEKVNFTPKIYFLERKSKIRELVSDEDILALENEFIDIIRDDSEKSLEALNADLERNRVSLSVLDQQIATPPSPYAVAGIKAGREAVLERIMEIEAELYRRQNPDLPESTPQDVDETELEDQTLEEPAASNPADDFFAGVWDGLNGKKETQNVNEPASEEQNKDASTDASEEDNTSSSISLTDARGNEFKLDPAGMREAGSIALRYPERVNAPVNKWLPRIMFVMMPFSMLMGAIFIRGRETAMLYDHLVHAAYIHAFSFLLLFVFILLVQFTPIPGLLLIYMLILLIYLPLSAKRMFKRSWFKTIITSYGVGFVYTLIMGVIIILLITVGVFDITKGVAQARAATL